MKKLLEILSNPSKRMPLETLRKCEVVLEKLDLKRVSLLFAFVTKKKKLFLLLINFTYIFNINLSMYLNKCNLGEYLSTYFFK